MVVISAKLDSKTNQIRSQGRHPGYHLSLLALLLAAGCASKSQDIKASYVSPVTYDSFSCEQLAAEGKRVSARASQVAGVQDKNRKDDTIKTTVGVLIFWPIIFANEGDGQTA